VSVVPSRFALSVGGVYEADITRVCGHVNRIRVSHFQELDLMCGFLMFAVNDQRVSESATHLGSVALCVAVEGH
jgi:hypothetical protein